MQPKCFLMYYTDNDVKIKFNAFKDVYFSSIIHQFIQIPPEDTIEVLL